MADRQAAVFMYLGQTDRERESKESRV